MFNVELMSIHNSLERFPSWPEIIADARTIITGENAGNAHSHVLKASHDSPDIPINSRNRQPSSRSCQIDLE